MYVVSAVTVLIHVYGTITGGICTIGAFDLVHDCFINLMCHSSPNTCISNEKL